MIQPAPAAILALGLVLMAVAAPASWAENPATTGSPEAPDVVEHGPQLDVLRTLAEQGNAESQYLLGVRYALGRDVQQDDVKAVFWYRLAAEQGDPKAQLVLAIRYTDGRGVPQDFVMAHVWYNLAAAMGKAGLHQTATNRRGQIASKMTDQQVAEAQKLAREWKPKRKRPIPPPR